MIKTSKSRRLLPLLLFTAVLILTACRQDGNPDGGTTEKNGIVIASGGESGFMVIRGDDSSRTVADAAVGLRDAINSACGTDIRLFTDFAAEHSASAASASIVVGITTDSLSAELSGGLRVDEYRVSARNGNIYLTGGSDAAVADAVTYFIDNCISDYSGNLIFTGEDEYMHNVSYRYDTLTLGGVPLHDFTIVYHAASEYGRDSAGAVGNAIEVRYGYSLPIAEDSASESDYEICVGAVSREAVRGICDGFNVHYSDWSVTAAGTRLFVTGEGIRSTDAAVDALINYLNTADGGDATLDGLALSGTCAAKALSVRSEGTELRVMTMNVLWSTDPGISTQRRAELLADIIFTYMPDVICFNEMCRDIEKYLPGLLAGKYDVFTPEYEDIFNGDFTGYTNSLDMLKAHTCATQIAVLRSSGIGVTDSGFRYTSEKWWIHSISWALLTLPGGSRVAVCGNHYGEMSTGNYATDTLKCIEDVRAKHGDVPFVITGDLYAWAGDVPYKTITAAGYIDTYYSAAQRVKDGFGSYHAVGSQVTGTTTPIDHIFCDSRFTALRHHLIADRYSQWASDHFPIYADLLLKVN